MDIRHTSYFHIGHHIQPSGWERANHHHPFHEMIIVVRGTQWAKAGDEQVELAQGDVALFTAGAEHHEWSRPGTVLETYFTGFTLDGLERNRFLQSPDHDGRIRQLAYWLYADRDANDAGIATQRNVLLQAILGEFFRDRSHEENELVACIRNYICSHLAEPFTLDLLARQAGLSKFHFVRSFSAACGRTPMEEVRRIRADYARDLILSSGLPFKEIAPRAGLGNVHAMCRTFRQLFNQTPGELRRFGRRRG